MKIESETKSKCPFCFSKSKFKSSFIVKFCFGETNMLISNISLIFFHFTGTIKNSISRTAVLINRISRHQDAHDQYFHVEKTKKFLCICLSVNRIGLLYLCSGLFLLWLPPFFVPGPPPFVGRWLVQIITVFCATRQNWPWWIFVSLDLFCFFKPFLSF